jgi:thioredoxin 1
MKGKHMSKKPIFQIMNIIGVLLLAGTLLFAGCSKGDTDAAKDTVLSKKSSEALPKMVDFKSPTCPPCRAMEPILAELAREYDHVFELEIIDVSLPENREAAMQNSIQYIPTQIFYDEEGKQIFRHTGFYSKQDILNKWKDLGYDVSAKK